MSKQLTCQKFIYKLHSARLRKEKWKLSLPIDEARRNDEVIALADSQILRWIDELNGVTDADSKAHAIKSEIKRVRKEPYSPANRRRIRKLYADLDALQFKPDYMCLIIDKEKDYYRACKGFTINGIKYTRLLGTNGGIKNSTIVFVSERLVEELRRRIENGRDATQPLVTAKLEAYKALTCSASNPVSMPNGVLVVNDVETTFKSDVIYLSNDEGGEPKMEPMKDYEITMDASDGYGLMLPSLAKRWSKELDLDYVMAGGTIRYSFSKGMVFAFDFLDFANKIGGTYIVKDAWGNDVDIRFVELVLTTSMVKLWNSYASCEDFLNKSVANGYSFGFSKTCPKELESEHNTNYQFLQSFKLDDDDIDELIKPTMDEIADVLGGDWRKAVLYLKGEGLTEKSVLNMSDDFIKAAMIDHRMLNDPFVQNSIYQMIKKRIEEAKVGVLKLHANYSIVSGDPYLLCQSIFGLEPTGILKAGEIYNKYWLDDGAKELLCFRAPMSCANNIRKVYPVHSKEASYWYKYMPTATIFNGWDTAAMALNGMDYDGDLVFLTDSDVLLRTFKSLPALMCVQRRADKCVPTEDDFIRSNIASFGNDIGQITNRITSMYDVQANYDQSSEEYKILDYRIQSGQLLQQDAIDKAKGIVSKPMERSWYDRHAVHKIEDDDVRSLYRRIVADKKPYFMRYIYPDLMRQYNTYIKNIDRKSLREFGLTIDELKAIPQNLQTERQREFIHYYELRMPVSVSDSVMNKICRRFEQRFDSVSARQAKNEQFDYGIMKAPYVYSQKQYVEIERLYKEYSHRLQKYTAMAKYDRTERQVMNQTIDALHMELRKECDSICPNSYELCNIALDLCYTRSTTKRFAWTLCGSEIIRNLLERNCGLISYPKEDPNGEVSFNGKRFSVCNVRSEVYEDEFRDA